MKPDRNNPLYVWHVAQSVSKLATTKTTFGELSALSGFSIEDICLSVTRHWEWTYVNGYTFPVVLINPPAQV